MSETILYIDDEEDFLNSITAILSRRGYRVIPARSGEEGLAVLRQQSVDVLISDYKMPGISGTDVLQQAKQLQPDVCVVLASAYPSTKNTLEAIKFGAFDFLVKPFKLEELLEVIQRGIHARHLQQQNKKILDRFLTDASWDKGLSFGSLREAYEPALQKAQWLAGRHAPDDSMFIAAATVLQGGVEALGRLDAAVSVVMNCKRKEGSDGGDLVTAALVAVGGQQALECFPRFFDVVLAAKQRMGSADGHGVAAAILASAGEQALQTFLDQTFEQLPAKEGSYDGLVLAAAILATQGSGPAKQFQAAKQSVLEVKQQIGTEDGDNITAAVLTLGGAAALTAFGTHFAQVSAIKERRGSYDATALAAAILSIQGSVKNPDFEKIYKELLLRGRGTHDGMAITAALLGMLEMGKHFRSYAEAWWVVHS